MWLTLIQIIVGIALIAIILLQAKGTGLGTAFGGQSQMYHSKRGVEKAVFILTIFLTCLFVVISILTIRL